MWPRRSRRVYSGARGGPRREWKRSGSFHSCRMCYARQMLSPVRCCRGEESCRRYRAGGRQLQWLRGSRIRLSFAMCNHSRPRTSKSRSTEITQLTFVSIDQVIAQERVVIAQVALRMARLDACHGARGVTKTRGLAMDHRYKGCTSLTRRGFSGKLGLWSAMEIVVDCRDAAVPERLEWHYSGGHFLVIQLQTVSLLLSFMYVITYQFHVLSRPIGMLSV